MAGTSEVVYSFRVPEGYVAFLYWIGVSASSEGATATWVVDGEKVDWQKEFKGQPVGSLDKPTYVNPPIVVQRETFVEIFSPKDWEYTVYMDGELYELPIGREDLAKLKSQAVGKIVEEVKGIVVPPAIDVLKIPSITPIPDPLQSKTVDAGKREEVYRFDLPKGCVGFIQQIGNLYYYGDYIYFWIDGRLIESPYIERVIGDINDPLRIEPWYRMPFYQHIRWEAQNNDTEDHKYQVLCHGFYVRKEDLPLLFRLAGVK
jgi:hypothetical protein